MEENRLHAELHIKVLNHPEVDKSGEIGEIKDLEINTEGCRACIWKGIFEILLKDKEARRGYLLILPHVLKLISDEPQEDPGPSPH